MQHVVPYVCCLLQVTCLVLTYEGVHANDLPSFQGALVPTAIHHRHVCLFVRVHACRGATTGCFHGPCQQFYHYPCARARGYQGYLHFSLDGKRLACMEHAPL